MFHSLGFNRLERMGIMTLNKIATIAGSRHQIWGNGVLARGKLVKEDILGQVVWKEVTARNNGGGQTKLETS